MHNHRIVVARVIMTRYIFFHLQVDFYRFSISWPRIFPDGTASSYNQRGMDYYVALVDELVSNGLLVILCVVVIIEGCTYYLLSTQYCV